MNTAKGKVAGQPIALTTLVLIRKKRAAILRLWKVLTINFLSNETDIGLNCHRDDASTPPRRGRGDAWPSQEGREQISDTFDDYADELLCCSRLPAQEFSGSLVLSAPQRSTGHVS
jgi:hypothetical protein